MVSWPCVNIDHWVNLELILHTFIQQKVDLTRDPLTLAYCDCARQCLTGPLHHATTLNLFKVVCCCTSLLGRYWQCRILLLCPGRGAEYCDQFVCLSVRKRISGTAWPIFTKFCVQIPCGHGSVLFWRWCNTLCTSGFMDDITFGRNGPYGIAWKAEPLTYYH